MPKVSFNGSTKIMSVTEAPVGSANSIDVKIDLYSDWKEWVLTSDNAKYEQAMRAVGGDPLPGSKALGDTYFLMNGWKIRPYEASHTMTVNGNLYCEDGTSPYIPTVGTYNVMVISAVSQLVSATIQQLPEIEYASFNGGVTIDVVNGSTGTDYPKGTAQEPVNNHTDAMAIATGRGFKKLYVIGSFTLGSGESLNNFEVIGQGADITEIVLTAGCTTSYTEFNDCSISGQQSGETHFYYCDILELSNIHCLFVGCRLVGPLHMHTTYADTCVLNDCYASDECIVDLNNSPVHMSFTNFSGNIRFQNLNKVTAGNIGLDLASGHVTIDATCTTGSILIRGVAQVTDNAPEGGTVVSSENLSFNTLNHFTFSNAVCVDALNGETGTKFPIGTRGRPSNNFTDAMTIAVRENLLKFDIIGSVTLDRAFTGYSFTGTKSVNECIINLNNQLIDDIVFTNCVVTGQENAVQHFQGEEWAQLVKVQFNDCYLKEVVDLQGIAIHCQVEGLTLLKPGGWFSSIETVIEGDFTVFDMRLTTGTTVSMDMNSGWAQFINCVTGVLVELNVKGGEIDFSDVSNTGGSYYIEGVGTHYPNATMTKIENHLIWDEAREYVSEAGSHGEAMVDMHDEAVGKWEVNPSGNTLTLYREDGVTVLKQFTLTEAAGTVPVYVSRTPV